ncbi:MAG: GNAT family N-acetyltransferase [Defluviitaleaceae bacterium]|nr:GNAT family N-acetyltransferase [Defluviitaleaceae bacterium]MCL2262910.1 GNAT family N-acetyltransferase [Defluviitaleaceae bacterium]
MLKLETARLILRPYGENDLDGYYRLLSDRKNMYYLDDIITETREEARQGLAEAIALMESGNARRFAITLKGQPNNIIGGAGYDVTDATPLGRVGHMGWFILQEHQNKGIVTEAAKRVLSYAFDSDNCIRITTGCYAENIPTQKVIAKVGFRREAEKIKAQYHDGEMKDRLEYAINRDERRN